jgi:hypothetical protein
MGRYGRGYRAGFSLNIAGAAFVLSEVLPWRASASIREARSMTAATLPVGALVLDSDETLPEGVEQQGGHE